jgi:hypothetical protein
MDMFTINVVVLEMQVVSFHVAVGLERLHVYDRDFGDFVAHAEKRRRPYLMTE